MLENRVNILLKQKLYQYTRHCTYRHHCWRCYSACSPAYLLTARFDRAQPKLFSVLHRLLYRLLRQGDGYLSSKPVTNPGHKQDDGARFVIVPVSALLVILFQYDTIQVGRRSVECVEQRQARSGRSLTTTSTPLYERSPKCLLGKQCWSR